MAQTEWILYVAAAVLYALSSAVFLYCLVFKKEERINLAVSTALAGLIFHSVSIALRWIETGHGPYISMYEVLSKYAWFSVVIFLISQQKYEKIKIAGFIVLPASFLMMAIGSTYSRDIQMIPASLQSYWLIAHVGFASIGFGSVMVAAATAALYILKEKHTGVQDSFYDRLPGLRTMDDIMYRFVAIGFFALTVMIAAGAIWANQTWGRYWGWDPIETWSLISWFTYGTCLHLRMNAGWTGKRIAWLIILSIFVLAFSAFGVGYVYSGLHTSYLTT
ncbi:MAG: c-type cytochrome biogenesis protein CcsB [Candidatus Methanoperedens sp.]|nr:c-type cytochrome biogenesis protein CcsB [Candidatus Methanoperedens sp.]